MLDRITAFFQTDFADWHEHRPHQPVRLDDGAMAAAGALVMRRIVDGTPSYRALTEDEAFAEWDSRQW